MTSVQKDPLKSLNTKLLLEKGKIRTYTSFLACIYTRNTRKIHKKERQRSGIHGDGRNQNSQCIFYSTLNLKTYQHISYFKISLEELFLY